MQLFIMLISLMLVFGLVILDVFKPNQCNYVKLRDRRLVAEKDFIIGGYLIPKGTVGAFIPRSVDIPSLDMPFWVDESASVTGDCTIGFNTYIGSDTIISDCTIMQNVVIEKKCQLYRTTFLDGVRIKNNCVCYDSVISQNTSIDFSCEIKSSTIAYGSYISFRTSVSNTTIGKKTKIDNDTTITNSVIGEYCCIGKLVHINEMCIPNICVVAFDDSLGTVPRVLDSTICVPYYCNDRCYLLLYVNDVFYVSGAVDTAISLNAKCLENVPLSVIDKFSSISKHYTKV